MFAPRSLAKSCRQTATAFILMKQNIPTTKGARLVIPADVLPERTERIRELAIKTFQVLGCGGPARVDFFLKGEDIFVNEVNTLPGFTSISMYPKLWEASWGSLATEADGQSDRSRARPVRATAAFDRERRSRAAERSAFAVSDKWKAAS